MSPMPVKFSQAFLADIQTKVVPLHAHENEQTTWMFSGTWRFQLEGWTIKVGYGEMIFVSYNVLHTAEATVNLVASGIL
jgi:quercetin dioxygenase-like cupin family protein